MAPIVIGRYAFHQPYEATYTPEWNANQEIHCDAFRAGSSDLIAAVGIELQDITQFLFSQKFQILRRLDGN